MRRKGERGRVGELPESTTEQFLGLGARVGRACGRDNYAVALAGCEAGAGASTLAFAFASAVGAHTGSTVLLVDGNLRTPALHAKCGVGRAPGLVEAVLDGVDPASVIAKIGHRGISVLPAGREVEHPILVYEAGRFSGILDTLRQSFTVVIFDAAPLNPHRDTPALAAKLDGLILVLDAGRTRWEVAQRVSGELKATGVALLGAILNRRVFPIPELIYRRV